MLRVMLLACWALTTTSDLLPSELTARPGHYPFVWCQLSNVVLSARHSTFFYVKNPASNLVMDEECNPVIHIWPTKERGSEAVDLTCDEQYEEGHAFTIFYSIKGSNYYHMHMDTTIPLYQILHHNQDSPPETVVLMPTIETRRLEELDWDTTGFQNPSDYWMQIMRPLMKDNSILLPLDRSFLNTSSNICFKNVYFGTPRVNYQNTALIQAYVKFMKSQLYVLERPLTIDGLRIGLISRNNRRRILNEQELLEAIRPVAAIDLIRFETLTVREQISLVQRYAVIVGMNGAGLMNALFRPEHAVAVQLVPYKAALNHVQFGELLTAVGPYMEWHNAHPQLHHVSNAHQADAFRHSKGDTIVNVTEFTQLVQTALGTVKDLLLGIKEEL